MWYFFILLMKNYIHIYIHGRYCLVNVHSTLFFDRPNFVQDGNRCPTKTIFSQTPLVAEIAIWSFWPMRCKQKIIWYGFQESFCFPDKKGQTCLSLCLLLLVLFSSSYPEGGRKFGISHLVTTSWRWEWNLCTKYARVKRQEGNWDNDDIM